MIKTYNVSIEWEHEDGGRYWETKTFTSQEEMNTHIDRILEKGGIFLSDIDRPVGAEQAPWL